MCVNHQFLTNYLNSKIVVSNGFVLTQAFSLRIHVDSNKIHVNKTRQHYDVKEEEEEEEEEEEDNMRNTIIWPAVCIKW